MLSPQRAEPGGEGSILGRGSMTTNAPVVLYSEVFRGPLLQNSLALLLDWLRFFGLDKSQGLRILGPAGLSTLIQANQSGRLP